MVENDFTKRFLTCNSADIPKVILGDISRISRMSGVEFDGSYYMYNSSYLICIHLTLELPTRYDPAFGLVRNTEPVFIQFCPDYPFSVPIAYIGRSDFDTRHTPHIYCPRNGMIPICLFRGNGNEWFASMEIEDFVKHLKSWYEDLASVANLENSSEFEPLRLEGCRGTMIYNYDALSSEIASCQPNQFCKLEPFIKLSNEVFIRFSEVIENLQYFKNCSLIPGIICRTTSNRIFDDYDADLPATFGDLKKYLSQYGILPEQFSSVIDPFLKAQFSKFIVILAIRRSCRLIGVASEYQLVNFQVLLDNSKDKGLELNDCSKVYFYKQIFPFIQQKAREMSGINPRVDPKLLVAGCGALGSKVSMHLIRSGITDILFVDFDRMESHNMSRHALLPDSIGVNKAYAMCKIAYEMFRTEKLSTQYIADNLLKALDVTKSSSKFKFDYILDFTASKQAFNQLVQITDRPAVISAAIYDDGKYALLFREDVDYGCRLDDLSVAYYARYKEDGDISRFLIREKQKAMAPDSIINVGLGCNSETFILADDVISLYASAMSLTLKSIFAGKESAHCWEYRLEENGSLSVKKYDFSSFDILQDEGWEIHISSSVSEQILGQTAEGFPLETGGYLIGQCNLKNKVIYVIDTVEAPSDTTRTEDSLVLGKENLTRVCSKIERKSGSTFGYIGEWHSHPNGPFGFSEIDYQEFNRKKLVMESNGDVKPVAELLVTPDGIIGKVLTVI